MGALIVVCAPHVPHLPVWVPGVLGVALLWRYRVYQGRWPFPPLPVRAALVLLSFLGVGAQFRTINGLDPAIALLVIAAGLKILEMRATRDYVVACFVGYFLASSQLLFEQEIPYAAAALAGLTGELSFPSVKAGIVRDLIRERVDPVLFALSRDFVGDTAETVSLLWPAPPGPGAAPGGPPIISGGI